MTIRFNETTWEENRSYRERNGMIGCIYGPSRQISEKISHRSELFVIEMNNTTNKIEGIGYIKNKYEYHEFHDIYTIRHYNRYIYMSKYRLNRNDIDPEFITLLEQLCFKGKTHSKRGCGFTLFPSILFQHTLLKNRYENHIKEKINDEIMNMFVTFYRNQHKNPNSSTSSSSSTPDETSPLSTSTSSIKYV